MMISSREWVLSSGCVLASLTPQPRLAPLFFPMITANLVIGHSSNLLTSNRSTSDSSSVSNNTPIVVTQSNCRAPEALSLLCFKPGSFKGCSTKLN